MPWAESASAHGIPLKTTMNDTQPDPPELAARAGLEADDGWRAAVAQWRESGGDTAALTSILAADDAPAFDPLPAGPDA